MKKSVALTVPPILAAIRVSFWKTNPGTTGVASGWYAAAAHSKAMDTTWASLRVLQIIVSRQSFPSPLQLDSATLPLPLLGFGIFIQFAIGIFPSLVI
jgi:hypothetical protein